jgi:mRNA-degrading endonuclease toxin of MazEF toxin-antitoxin module
MLRGEVWWVDFDPSLGGEVQKTRPVIVGNDASNRYLNRLQVAPWDDIRAIERALRLQLGLDDVSA